MAGGSARHTVVTSAGRARLPALPDTPHDTFLEIPVSSHSPSTLHDFVLDLLSDPTALASFQSDAEGALADAGLSDISALDVQEVIPLVLDYVPTEGLPALDGSLLNDLPLDVVDAGPAGAISQLQAVAQQLTGGSIAGSSELNQNLAVASAVTADANGLDVFGGISAWGELGDVAGAGTASVAGDFSAVNDVTDTLDGTLGTATGQVGSVADLAHGQVDGVHGAVGGVAGSLPGTESLTSTVFGQVDSLTGVVDNVTGGLGNSIDIGHSLDVAGLGHSGSGDLALSGNAPVADAVDTATGLVHGTGVGDVVGNVTDAAHLPVVDSLGVDHLLY